MYSNLKLFLWSLLARTVASAQTKPGYAHNVPSTVTNASLSFGQHYAVLNLDLIEALVSSVNMTTDGKSFINNTATWIDAVHQQTPPPLSIFTRLFYSNAQEPEIGPNTPFRVVTAALGNITETSPSTQLYSAFTPLAGVDVVLQKTRYYAGSGNSVEEILSSQGIDTVLMVCFPNSIVLTTVDDYEVWYSIVRRHPEHSISVI
jgi:nicotinamidase-related amidase